MLWDSERLRSLRVDGAEDGDILAVADALPAAPETTVDGLVEGEATPLQDPLEGRRSESDGTFWMQFIIDEAVVSELELESQRVALFRPRHLECLVVQDKP